MTWKESMKYRKWFPVIYWALIPFQGWIVLAWWVFRESIRYGDELAEYSRASYAQFCERRRKEGKL